MESRDIKPKGTFDPLSSNYFASLPLIMQETIIQSYETIEDEEDLRMIAMGLLDFNNNNNIDN